MKAILSSAGLITAELAETLSRLAGKPFEQISIAVISEASAMESGDKRWFFNEMNILSHLVGGEIDMINLLALDLQAVEHRIKCCDVIYVSGGFTDYLMKVFLDTGFDNLLTSNLLNDKIYVGSSAGSMVLGRRISTAGYADVYRKGERNLGISEYLSCVDFAIIPHLDSPIFTRNRIDILRRAAEGFTRPIYAIKDEQAVIVDGNDVYIVGGEVAVVK